MSVREWGTAVHWKTTYMFFPFRVQLLATGNLDGFSSNGVTVIKGPMLSCSSIPLRWRVEAKLLPVEIRNYGFLNAYVCSQAYFSTLLYGMRSWLWALSLNPPSASNSTLHIPVQLHLSIQNRRYWVQDWTPRGNCRVCEGIRLCPTLGQPQHCVPRRSFHGRCSQIPAQRMRKS